MKRRDFLQQPVLFVLAGGLGQRAQAASESNDQFDAAASKGRRFLGSLFDPTLDLLPEYRGARAYWLYHDNYLASKILRPTHPEVSERIEKAIHSYGVTESGKIEVVFDEAKQPLPFRHPELIEVQRFGNKIVKTEVLTKQLLRGWEEYADLLLLAAMAKSSTDPSAAKKHLNQALAMWDGTGVKDRATREIGRYAVYKLALATVAAVRLNQRPAAVAAILDRLLAQQSEAGGWITDYTAGGKRVGLANVETTSLAVLALDAITGQDPAGLTRIRTAKTIQLKQPVMFDTPEADAILSALEIFPPDNPFNQVVDQWPLHPNSRNIVASIGEGKPFRYNTDMAFVLVPSYQPRVAVDIVEYSGESDAGPFPIPDNIPIEGWPVSYQRTSKDPPTLSQVQLRPAKYEGDRHAIVVDPVNRMLYEFFTFGKTEGGWAAGQASVFDLKTNKLRPDGWTSADAAGLPIFPAVVRYDEIKRGIVEHAMRVTVRRTRRAYVHPATHYASQLTDENLPRMGERLRLRADFDISEFSPPVQAILKGLKKHGMLVADNGIDWAISVTPDRRIPVLHQELRKIKGSDFEVVVAPR